MWKVSFFDDDFNFVVSHVVEGDLSVAEVHAYRIILSSEVFLRKIVFERIL